MRKHGKMTIRMAYEMVMPYHLHMPSYFLETFTEYPFHIFVDERNILIYLPNNRRISFIVFKVLSDLLEQSKSSSHLIVTQTLFSLHDATFNSKFQIRSESEFIYLHFLRKFIGMIIEPYDHFI